MFALIVYLLRSLRNFVWTLVFSPATVFLDPVGAFAGLIITPVVAVGVALCCVVFWVGGKIGLDKVIDWASDKWADGYSMPNWVSLSVPLDDDEGPVLRKLGAVRPALSAAESRLVRYGKHHRASGGSPDPPGRWRVHSTILAAKFSMCVTDKQPPPTVPTTLPQTVATQDDNPDFTRLAT